MISIHILLIDFLNEPEFIFLHRVEWFHVFLSNTNNFILLIFCLHTVKWYQVLLCITNNSIKHQSFVYTPLNDQTVLFLTIQFSMSQQS